MRQYHLLYLHRTRAHFLSLVRSKLRLCSANHRPGYWSNLPCDWPSTAWAYYEQETETGQNFAIIVSVDVARLNSKHNANYKTRHFTNITSVSWRLKHRHHDYLFNSLFRSTPKKTSKSPSLALYKGNQSVTGGFLAQRTSNTESISISMMSSWIIPKVGLYGWRNYRMTFYRTDDIKQYWCYHNASEFAS